MAHAGYDDPEEEKIHEVDHGSQTSTIAVLLFEMSLSLDHCHTKLSVKILEMFPHTIKLR